MAGIRPDPDVPAATQGARWAGREARPPVRPLPSRDAPQGLCPAVLGGAKSLGMTLDDVAFLLSPRGREALAAARSSRAVPALERRTALERAGFTAPGTSGSGHRGQVISPQHGDDGA